MRNKKLSAIITFIILLLIINVAGAQNNQDYELTADQLLIDDANAKVVATGNVKFSQGEVYLSADKLTAKQQLNLIEADGNVIVNQLGRKLTAEHLNLNNQTEIAIFTGNPKYKTKQILIKGKRFKVNLKTEELVVTDQVYLENKDQSIKAEANNLTYDQNKQEAVLTGDVFARRGERRMTANKMQIDLETNKIKAEGKTKLVVPNTEEKSGDNNGN